MNPLNPIKSLLKPNLKLMRGTRFVSSVFIAASIIIAAGFLFAANTYYNIDTGEIVMEEIQRVTGLVKATAGLVVGVNQSLPAGVIFMATTSDDVLLGGQNQELRFSGATNYYTGFKATSTLAATTVYAWPGTYPAATEYYLTANPTTGEMSWGVPSGAGDITAVGNINSGPAFTQTASNDGNQLYFEGTTADSNEILLIGADPLADATITLPAMNGTLTLATTTLTTGSVLFASPDGFITQDNTSLFWDNSNNRLGIGTNSPSYLLDVNGTIRTGMNGTDGQLRIYSEQGATDYQIVFQPAASMTQDTTYTLPPDDGILNYVLTTDGSGVLSWAQATSANAVQKTGTPLEGQVAFFYNENTIVGENNLFWASSTDRLGIGTSTPSYALDVIGTGRLSTSLIAPLITYAGALSIQSTASGNITLDAGSNVIQLGTNDVIYTSGNHPIRASGEQIVRGAVSILGFDLPVLCNTSCSAGIYATTTRFIENADGMFPTKYAGTTRIYRFSIRYADATTTVSTTWRVATSSDPTYVTGGQFTLPPTSSTDLAKGFATTTGSVTLPSSGPWFLRTTTGGTGLYDLKIYDIMLLALDQVD